MTYGGKPFIVVDGISKSQRVKIRSQEAVRISFSANSGKKMGRIPGEHTLSPVPENDVFRRFRYMVARAAR